jgi:hypothetical protein
LRRDPFEFRWAVEKIDLGGAGPVEATLRDRRFFRAVARGRDCGRPWRAPSTIAPAIRHDDLANAVAAAIVRATGEIDDTLANRIGAYCDPEPSPPRHHRGHRLRELGTGYGVISEVQLASLSL